MKYLSIVSFLLLQCAIGALDVGADPNNTVGASQGEVGVPCLEDIPLVGPLLAQAAAVSRTAQQTAVAAANNALEDQIENYVYTAKVGGSRRGGRSLVIQSSPPEAARLAETEEDLNVMSRILDKAVESRGDDRAKASGINLFLWPGGGGGGIQGVYLEGHGALFFMKVKYPLLPPPAEKEESKAKPSSNSEWEQTKRELYGRREVELDVNRAIGRLSTAPEPYSESKVQRLKESLLEALKQAANMRHLKPEEFVTVAVTTEAGGGTDIVRNVMIEPRTSGSSGTGYGSGGGGSGAGGVYSSRHGHLTATVKDGEGSGGRAQVLTIRAKKADIDAFAQDKLTSEQFREKAKVQLY